MIKPKKFIKVYVLNMRGQPLMPCSPVKARILLKQGKAKVVKRTPFTIQLNIATGETLQPITLGMDSGYEHIGLSAVSTLSVNTKQEGLSATIDIREVFAAQVNLRKDVSKLITERRMYRRNRRNRKTRYRKARFLNRIRNKRRDKRIKRRRDVWLAPSIQHKLDSHIRIVQKVVGILPITKVVAEVANFDIQQLKADLAGSGKLRGSDYQRGEQLGYDNVRAYVLHRDNHTCQHCKGRSKDVRLNAHHIVFRSQGGSDRPDNLITLCETCHDALHRGDSHQEHHRVGLKLKVKPSRGFRAETFMSTVRRMIVDKLRRVLPNITVEETYGYVTKSSRQSLGLPKSHINDAYATTFGAGAITYGSRAIRGVAETIRSDVQFRDNLPTIVRSNIQYLVKQVRKQNRKLFKGKRSETPNKVPRYLFGFQRYDKVKYFAKDGSQRECFIFGRRSTGQFDIRTLGGERLSASANYKKLKLLESAGTWLWGNMFHTTPIPPTTKVVGFLGGPS